MYHVRIVTIPDAGVYVPTLAKEVLTNAPQVNLVAVAVGDPCTDNTAQRDSMDMLWYVCVCVPVCVCDLLFYYVWVGGWVRGSMWV